MAADWWKLSRGAGTTVDGDPVIVVLSDGRRHTIEVRDTGDRYALCAVVARPAALRETPMFRSWRGVRTGWLG